MTYITCRLTAKNRDQLRNPTLGNRVWATFAFCRIAQESVSVQHGDVLRWRLSRALRHAARNNHNNNNTSAVGRSSSSSSRHGGHDTPAADFAPTDSFFSDLGIHLRHGGSTERERRASDLIDGDDVKPSCRFAPTSRYTYSFISPYYIIVIKFA